jgi:hypothetical protein
MYKKQMLFRPSGNSGNSNSGIGKSQDTFVQFREIRKFVPEKHVFTEYALRSSTLQDFGNRVFGHFFPEMSQICKKVQKNAKNAKNAKVVPKTQMKFFFIENRAVVCRSIEKVSKTENPDAHSAHFSRNSARAFSGVFGLST